MSYLNPSQVTDIHFKKIAGAAFANISTEIALLDLEIENVCESKGVDADDIPVDVSDYMTSATLIEYATYWICHRVFMDHWGASQGENDIYYEKSIRYKQLMNDAYNQLTTANILMSDLEKDSFTTEVIIY